MIKKDPIYFKLIIIALLFLLLAFDRDMAIIYILILLGDYIWYTSDKFISFPIEKTKSKWTTSLFTAIAAYGIFLGIATVLTSTLSPESLTLSTGAVQSIFELLATSTPILQGSKILTLVGWGILIPIIETSFWNGRLLEGFAEIGSTKVGKKIPLTKIDINTFIVMVFIAATFSLFHITAKGLSAVPLMITFVFSLVSSYLVIRDQETKSAILLHIISNSAVVIASYGLF